MDSIEQEMVRHILNYLSNKSSDSLWSLIRKFGPHPMSESWDIRFENSELFDIELFKEYRKRQLFIRHFSWAVPSPSAIEEITRFLCLGNDKRSPTPVLEINAGKGLWSHLLELQGVQITATDVFLMENSFTSVLLAEATHAVEKYFPSGGCLMTCWPDYATTYANDALQLALSRNLKKFIYIGEASGGCTGEISRDLLNQLTLFKEVKIPQWWGIYDRIFLYLKKESN